MDFEHNEISGNYEITDLIGDKLRLIDLIYHITVPKPP